MLSLDQIKSRVVLEGNGKEMRELPDWFWSKGICFAYDNNPELWKPFVAKALAQCGTDNFGGYYKDGETPMPGKEYYLCESPYGNDLNTGIIIHRDNGCLEMYFQFER